MDAPFQPKRITQERRSGSWKQAVVYDPARQTLGIKAEEKLEGTHKISTQSLPRFANRVRIYAEEEGPHRRKSLVATVNLDRLGWSAKIKRLFGTIDHLYVMELPHGAQSPTSVVAAAA